MLFLLYRVCKNVRLGILETSLCVYAIVHVEGMHTCNTEHFDKRAFVCMLVLL